VTIQTLQDAGTVDQDALDALGALEGELVTPTSEQAEAAAALLAEKWAGAVS
jgi:putative spermidine/putrescine transport system substrate-binding protein